MSRADDLVAAIRAAGGRSSRATLQKKLGWTDMQMSNGVFAAKKRKLIERDGHEYALKGSAKTKISGGEGDHPGGAKKTAQKRATGAVGTDLAPINATRIPVTIGDASCRAIRTADGGALVIDGGFVLHELNAPAVAALGALFRVGG